MHEFNITFFAKLYYIAAAFHNAFKHKCLVSLFEVLFEADEHESGNLL